MGCHHDYILVRKDFVCKICGKRYPGPSKRKRRKKIALVIFIIILLGTIVFYDEITKINPNEIFQIITETSLRDVGESVEKAIDEIPKNKVLEPPSTTEEESRIAIQYINEIRRQYGVPSIEWDSRVFALASAWTKELHETKQFDHTNPITGNCPYSLKSEFGLGVIENVAENLYSSSNIRYNPSHQDAVAAWLDSKGHRYNLLYYQHVGGAYACYGGTCSFLGLNYDRFGEGCYTAAEGEAFWGL